MADLVVVVPVLGRPESARPVADSLFASTDAANLLFVVSPDDDAQRLACLAAMHDLGTRVRVRVVDFEPGPGDFARKINAAYRATTEPWIFQAADDVRFEPGWDTAALVVAERTGALVVGTQDGGNPAVKRGRHSTHTLIARSYVDDPGASADGPGSVFSEAYGHQMCDVELVELAKARGVWAFANSSRVIHEHPFWNRAVVRDATYERGLASSSADQRIYARRRRMWAGLAKPARV